MAERRRRLRSIAVRARSKGSEVRTTMNCALARNRAASTSKGDLPSLLDRVDRPLSLGVANRLEPSEPVAVHLNHNIAP
jgi:hypothetical protein